MSKGGGGLLDDILSNIFAHEAPMEIGAQKVLDRRVNRLFLLGRVSYKIAQQE